MKQLLIGIDVGSTTTKITVLDKTTESLLYSDYRRHHADQLASVLFAIRQAAEKFPDTEARIILTGSGANRSQKQPIPLISRKLSQTPSL